MTFTGPELLDFRLNTMFELLSVAQSNIRPDIPSRTLRRTLQLRVPNNRGGREGDLFLPQFWATIVHDGRSGFGPKTAKFLTYFQDPDDDPRKPTPARAAQQRSLTRAEFYAGVAENKRREQVNPGGGPMQFMLIIKTAKGLPGRVGPAAAQPFFLGPGAKRFEAQAPDIVFRELDKLILAGAVALSERAVARGIIR